MENEEQFKVDDSIVVEDLCRSYLSLKDTTSSSKSKETMTQMKMLAQEIHAILVKHNTELLDDSWGYFWVLFRRIKGSTFFRLLKLANFQQFLIAIFRTRSDGEITRIRKRIDYLARTGEKGH